MKLIAGDTNEKLDAALDEMTQGMEESEKEADKLFDEFKENSEKMPTPEEAAEAAEAAATAPPAPAEGAPDMGGDSILDEDLGGDLGELASRWRRITASLEACGLPAGAWTRVYYGLRSNPRYNIHQVLGDLQGYAARQGKTASARLTPQAARDLIFHAKRVLATAHLLEDDELAEVLSLINRAAQEGIKEERWRRTREAEMRNGHDEAMNAMRAGVTESDLSRKPDEVVALEVHYNSPFATDADYKRAEQWRGALVDHM
jgi:hypothetical protein